MTSSSERYNLDGSISPPKISEITVSTNYVAPKAKLVAFGNKSEIQLSSNFWKLKELEAVAVHVGYTTELVPTGEKSQKGNDKYIFKMFDTEGNEKFKANAVEVTNSRYGPYVLVSKEKNGITEGSKEFAKRLNILLD